MDTLGMAFKGQWVILVDEGAYVCNVTKLFISLLLSC